MANMHHSMAQLEGAGTLMIAFKILDTSGTPTITEVTAPSFQSGDIAITDTGTGIYDVVISNFKGPQGYARVFVTANTDSLFAGVSARSYTGDALAITINVNDDASTATDASVDVLVLAY